MFNNWDIPYYLKLFFIAYTWANTPYIIKENKIELKKLMEHISIILDYRQARKVKHKLFDILLLTICALISGAEGWEDIDGFWETHLDFFNNMVILKMVFLFTIPLPELYSVSVLQNFMSVLLTGCVIVILKMIKTSLQLMEKRSGILMTRVVAGERFMSLVRSQLCTVWSSDRSRRMNRNYLASVLAGSGLS